MAFPFSNSLIPLKIKVKSVPCLPKALHDLFAITSLTSSPPLSLVHVAIFASLPLFRPISKPLRFPSFPFIWNTFPKYFCTKLSLHSGYITGGNRDSLKIQRPCKGMDRHLQLLRLQEYVMEWKKKRLWWTQWNFSVGHSDTILQQTLDWSLDSTQHSCR